MKNEAFNTDTITWFGRYEKGEPVPTVYREFFEASKEVRYLDTVRGCLYGCAVGDALGAPVEFSRIQGGSKFVTGLSSNVECLYTDDTQMTLRTVQGLLNAATWTDFNKAGQFVGQQYIFWAQNDPPRAPGNSCLRGCSNLRKLGIDRWRECGTPDGGGCGTVMRSSPYGLWHNVNIELAAKWAGEHSYMTHGHVMASSAAAAMGAATAYLFHNNDPKQLVVEMVRAAAEYSVDTATMLLEASDLASVGADPKDVLARFLGWRGDEAIAASLYCLLMCWDSFKDAVLLSVNSPGDSDSLGAITGALAGTLHGFDAIPIEWTELIENSAGLEEMSQVLTRVIW